MTTSQNLKILLTGGGSGGHIYPLSAVALELKKIAAEKNFTAEIHYLGATGEFYKPALLSAGVEIHSLISAKLRRYFSFANFIDIPKFFISFFQALIKILILMPDVTFSKGGPGALPVVLASWFYQIPVMIHESDAVPGMANLLSKKIAKRIALSFDRAAHYFNSDKVAVIGNPIRADLLNKKIPSAAAKEELGFDPNEPLILILGGSQGAKRINDFILINLEDLIKEAQILHQTGPANYLEVKNLSRAVLVDIPTKTQITRRYEAVSYFEQNIATALSAADLIISRGGSNILFEIAAFRKPVIIIPLSDSAGDHQRLNAYEFAKTGGGVVIEENNLFPVIFMNQIREIIENPQKLAKMGELSATFFKPGAAQIIADEIIHLGGF
ncbi:MAG: UDP-N-acetylglucosamine--N-acetylmuramyl-(pentapeptide) pyrophosphoryl-undecaprenol N-acetylglucosamine transferase [Candidatus Paceibacterota bacterium]|jgi:UDP-N-acetylglucosamine--N-acetylmuramyl-(pentapeptide) pyrophosphoryl-undecaprenol N-acetylglucosamine transferase